LKFASICHWTGDLYHNAIEMKIQDRKTSGSVTIDILKNEIHENEAYLRTGKLTRCLTFDLLILKEIFQGLFHKAVRTKYHYLFGQKTFFEKFGIPLLGILQYHKNYFSTFRQRNML